MADEVIKINIPLDDDKFLRRECDLCKSEFKIEITEEELNKQTELLIEKYLDDKNDTDDNNDTEDEKELYFCPYCGQEAEMKTFWTQAQLEYIGVYAKNLMNRLINEHFIKEMKKLNRSSGGILKFEGSEIPYIEPFIAPEDNDMEVFGLKCCNKKVKVNSSANEVFCFYCGFKHKIHNY